MSALERYKPKANTKRTTHNTHNTHTKHGYTQNQIAYSYTEGVPIRDDGGCPGEVSRRMSTRVYHREEGNVKRIRDQTNCQVLIQDPDEKSGRKSFRVRRSSRRMLRLHLRNGDVGEPCSG